MEAYDLAGDASRTALGGVRVLDFGRFIAGPGCAAILGDLGADVIRIDKPGGSEDRHTVPVTAHGEGTTFIQNNRNKRSLELDPGTAGGAEIVRRLVATSDIVIANMPEQVLAELGIDYDRLAAINPRIIYLLSTAYGTIGPYAGKPGFDGVGQVMSGAAYRSGHPGEPMRAGVPYIDHSTALCGVIAVLAALVHRDRTGEGQLVETSLIGTALLMASSLLMEEAITGVNRRASGNRSQLAAPADVFNCRDAAILVQAAGQPMYRRWARLMGEEHWLSDPRFATDALRGENGGEISRRMSAWCAGRSRAEALAELEAARIAAYPVYSPREALGDEHLRQFLKPVLYRGLSEPALVVETPFRMHKTPPRFRRSPPELGADTEALLREVGYSDDEIDSLREAGVIPAAPHS